MTKTKRQLRAEAVERLNGMVLGTGSAIKKLAIALGVTWNPSNSLMNISALQNTLTDLLTDDCDTECYECAKLAELVAENSQLRVKVGELEAERDEWKTKCETREVAYKQADAERKRYREQIDELIAERDEWKAKAEGSSKVRAGSSDDGVKRSMTNLDWLMENDFEALQNQMGGQPCSCCLVGCEDDLGSDEACDAALREWLMAPHEDEGDESCRQDADQRERAESADCESDTREKLEADANGYVMSWWQSDWVDCFDHADSMKRDIMRLLDRQAAITERHWMEIVGASANANVELKRQIDERQARADELTEQLESAHAKNRSLKAHIAKMQEGRHGWHVKYLELEKKNAELEAERDELRSKLDELTERKCPGYEPESHYCRYYNQDFELNHQTVSRLKRENAELRRDFGECIKERMKATARDDLGREIILCQRGED